MSAADRKPNDQAGLGEMFEAEISQTRSRGNHEDYRFTSRYFRLQRRRNIFYIAGAIAVLISIIVIAWIAYDDTTVVLNRRPNTIPLLVEIGDLQMGMKNISFQLPALAL